MDKAAILQAMDNVDYKAVRRAALALSLKSDEERVAMLLTVADALDAALVFSVCVRKEQQVGSFLVSRLHVEPSRGEVHGPIPQLADLCPDFREYGNDRKLFNTEL